MAVEASTYHLGIDLGTTYTAAAVRRDDRVTIVQLTADSHAMPSVVALREDGEMIAGEAAVRRAASEPRRVAREFKRRFGDTAPIVLGGTRTSAEELTGALLREVLRRVEVVEGATPSTVTLTHPATWGPFRLDKLREVAAGAGLGAVELVPEPVAAAIAGGDRLESGSLAVIYDLGGGTFDAAVVRVGSDELLGSPEGVERLGGVDIDALVLAHVDDATGGLIGDAPIDDPETLAGLARLREDCRVAKEALSTDSETDIAVQLPNVRATVRLTRTELEGMVRPRLADSLAALDRTVASAGAAWPDVAAVLVVGGSSRMPLIAQLVREHTNRPVITTTNPNLAVALGAAHGSAVLSPPSAPADQPAAAIQPAPAVQPASSATASTSTGPSSRRGRGRLVLAGAVVAAFAIVAAVVLLARGDGDGSSATTDRPGAGAGATGGAAGVVTVGPAKVAATACTDATGLIARATSIDIDTNRVAVVVDGAIRVLTLKDDCSTASGADGGSVVPAAGQTFSALALAGDRLVASTGRGGAVIDLTRSPATSTPCPGLRSVIAFTAGGTLASFDVGTLGYDEYDVASGTCTLLGTARNARAEFLAAVGRGSTLYLATAVNGGGVISRFDGSVVAWVAGDKGGFASIAGLSICGPYLCALDAKGGDLVLLAFADGAEVGRVAVKDLTGESAVRLRSSAEGWLVTRSANGETRLRRLEVS